MPGSEAQSPAVAQLSSRYRWVSTEQVVMMVGRTLPNCMWQHSLCVRSVNSTSPPISPRGMSEYRMPVRHNLIVLLTAASTA